MRYYVVSSFAYGLGFWTRLRDEGHQVVVHLRQKDGPYLTHRYVGKDIKGIEKVESWAKLKSEIADFAKGGNVTVVFESSGLGEFADEIRKMGVPVLGGGKFCDRLENEREFGFQIAARNGCDVPEYQVFHSLSETISHVFRHGLVVNGKKQKKVFFKTNAYIDGDTTHSADSPEDLIRYIRHVRERVPDKRVNILQGFIDGVAVSTARWWNGVDWVGPYEGTIERKKFMSDEIGPATGCAVNAVWFYPEAEPKIAKALNWSGLTPTFRTYKAPPGLYDINAIVANGKAWFLEWTPRFGWDSEGTSLCLLYQNLSDWLEYVATGKLGPGLGLSNQIGYAMRLTVPPYPWEHGSREHKESAMNIGIWGPPTRNLSGQKGFIGYELMGSKFAQEWSVAAPEGIVGLACASAPKLSTAHEKALEACKQVKTSSSLMYRTDGLDAIQEDAIRAREEGFSLHPGLYQ